MALLGLAWMSEDLGVHSGPTPRVGCWLALLTPQRGLGWSWGGNGVAALELRSDWVEERAGLEPAEPRSSDELGAVSVGNPGSVAPGGGPLLGEEAELSLCTRKRVGVLRGSGCGGAELDPEGAPLSGGAASWGSQFRPI